MKKKSLKILFVCAELSPIAASGGLADVAAALPRALREQGHDVRIALPCYDTIAPEYRGREYCLCVAELGSKTAWGTLRISETPETAIPLYLIEHHGYFSRGRMYGQPSYEFEDNAERFCFFSQAVLHAIPQTGWQPDVVHCHDWHTAIVPALIKTRFGHTPAWRGMPTVFTIHNLGYQGRYRPNFMDVTGLGWYLFNPACLEFYGDLNLMKAGIAFASKVNTVSPRYAHEIQTPEFGEGLDGFLRRRRNDLSGILNGVDYSQWNPETDNRIAANYSLDDMSGKIKCKRALQESLGLEQSDKPLIGMVTRIHWQKGMDLLVGALDRILDMGVQFVMLGSGDPYYEKQLWDIAQRRPDAMRIVYRYDLGLAHQIEAGSDFFVMPSHYEPCGLSQLYSLAYGTPPIVRETGGLADSVRDISRENLEANVATGIYFQDRSSDALAHAVWRAVELYYAPGLLKQVREAGMRENFTWERSSHEYVDLYRAAMRKP
jgi:starch synthase